MEQGFPYEEFRRGQRESLTRVERNLGKVIALKAPTGFGKTVVAILSHSKADRVLYAVRTRNEMSPVIKELVRVSYPFTIVFSGRRMCPLLKGRSVPSEDFWINCRVLRSRGVCPYFQNLPRVSSKEVMGIMESSPPDPHAIASNIASMLQVCPFFVLTQLVRRAKFVVVTYPYLFRDDIFRIAFPDLGLDEFYVVVDEAHTLLNPQSLYEEEVSERVINEALKEVRAFNVGEEVWSYLKGLREVVARVRSRMLTRVDKSRVYPGEGTLYLIEDAILDVRLKKLREFLNNPGGFTSITTRLSKIAKFLTLVREHWFRVYGVVSEDGFRELKVLPISYEPITQRLAQTKGVLLMSGTLPPKDIVKVVVSRDPYYIDVEGDYGPVFPRHNRFYVVHAGLTSSYRYRGERTFLGYAELITKIYEGLREGVVLATYPSYPFMERVLDNVTNIENQVVEGRGTTLGDVVKASKEADKLVVHAVAGGKLAEGIELLRDGVSAIKIVAVLGVPYTQPDDYVRDLREELRRYLTRSLADELVMDVPASIRTLQALGRAIRSGRDRAFMVLADRRFLTPRLRRILNLRYEAVARSTEEVVKLMKAFFEGFL